MASAASSRPSTASGIALWRDPVARARSRLAIQFALLCAAVLCGSGVAVYSYVRHTLHAAFDAAHDLALRSVLETLKAETGPGTRGTEPTVRRHDFDEEFDELEATLGVVEAGIWSAEGTLLAGAAVHGWSSPSTPPAGPDREERLTPRGPVVVRRARVAAERGGGVVVVTREAGSLERDLDTFRRGLVLFFPVAVLASLGMGWWMAGRSLRPVRVMIDQQRTFMADASHELRTPLAILQTHAEVGARDEADAASMRTSLAVVARTASQLGDLVGDLMYLARSDASPLKRHRVPVDLEDLLEETVQGFAPLAKSKGSRIRLAKCGAIDVSGDPSQLKRLVTLLLDNALRHGDPGDIDVSLTVNGTTVELRIADPGPGIADDLLPRVFERFVRGDRARAETSGHGLGLAIAQSIVAGHRGSLTLHRNERGGTTACAVLPSRSTSLAHLG